MNLDNKCSCRIRSQGMHKRVQYSWCSRFTESLQFLLVQRLLWWNGTVTYCKHGMFHNQQG